MSNIILRSGEVWRTRSRKRELTLRLLEDVDPDSNKSFAAELIEGTPRYLTIGVRAEQPGETINMRTNLTQFIKRLLPPG